MTVKDFLRYSVAQLEKAGIGTARLDALVLLEDALSKDRAWLLAHSETVVKGETFHKLQEQVEKRSKHIPLAQIRSKTEFYGREFYIDERVLEPRPESETMIELALEVTGDRLQVIDKIRIVDVGTGSGAIGITAALEAPKAEIVLTDIDPKCLEVAQKNAKKHTVKAQILQGNFLEPLYNLRPSTYNLILANLPYVPDSYEINQAALNEPKVAIFGGVDGLELYRELFRQIVELKHKPQYVFTESLPFQHDKLATIAKKSGYVLHKSEDFIQVFTPN